MKNMYPKRYVLQFKQLISTLTRSCFCFSVKNIHNSPATFYLLLFLLPAITFSQSITVGARSHLVMNDAVSLVVKDAAFINNGNFTESVSTVKFTGYADTVKSYLSGSNPTTFYNLTTQKSAYGTALKSMGNVKNVLNVSAGHLYCDSNLRLLSTASLTARVAVVPAASNIYGKAMVERYLPGRRAWRLLTAPVTSSNTIFNTWQNAGVYEAGKGMYVTGPNPTGAGGNGLDTSIRDNVSMKRFDFTTQGFTNVSNTHSAISSGSAGSADNVGYFTFVRGDRTYANFNYGAGICNTTTLTSIGRLQTSTQTFTATTDSAKFTLIGNPYASPIDFNSVSRNNLVKRFNVWDPALGTVGAWVVLDDIDNDGIYTKSIPASNMTKNIQSGQAFFVETNGNVGSASITINESSKCGCTQNNVMGRPSGEPGITQSLRSSLYLANADSAILADAVITEFNAGYSEKTNQEDASKFTNTNESLGLLRNGLGFSIERRPLLTEADTIFFKLWKTTQRNYRFEFTPSFLTTSGLYGFLEDSYLHTASPVSLSQSTTINFSIDANTASAAVNRFRIIFKPVAILPVTITHVKAYLHGNNIAVEWKVENEINITKYEVEKSLDGSSFTKVNTKNVVGTNNTSSTYNWLDENAVPGNNFYRIKIIETNGQIKYSTIVKVAIDKTAGGITIYPNPVKNNTIILQFNNQKAGAYQIQLINNTGQVMYKNTIQNNGGSSTGSINLPARLAAGIYQLEIISPDKNRVIQKLFAE